MEREPRRIKPSVWAWVMVLVLGLSVGGSIWYTKQPGYRLRQYIKAVNSRDYEKVYDTFLQDNLLMQFSKEGIQTYMMRYGQNIEFIKLEKGKMSYANHNQAFYEVVYRTEKGNRPQVLSLVKQAGRWCVIFPFETSSLRIDAPEGTSVSINGRIVKAGDEGNRNIQVLPGRYTVRMVYPNGLQEDYVTKIKVPEVSEVVSPYTTIPVKVESPIGTVVELAGVQKQNTTGEVIFEKVLEGSYELKVFDQRGMIEPVVKDIKVSKNLEPIQMNNMVLSKAGEVSFKQFVSTFYEAYLGSIRVGDVGGLDGYLSDEGKVEIEKDFKGWFVDHKTITKADMTIELDEVKVNQDGGVTADILEIVTMTNKEISESGKAEEKQYQVMLRWSSDFEVSGAGYRLENREIIESMVAQKDSKGNWVQY